MNPAISQDFNFKSLIKFATPTIIMMMFMSLYTIVDGVFVSRFVGTRALSAVNLVYPISNILMAIAIMLQTGGSAVVARLLGEGRPEKARENFTFLTLVSVGVGTVLAVVGLIFLEPICRMLGADELLLPYCMDYLRILLIFSPALSLQLMFQSFFVAAGRPGLGLGLTVGAGLLNAVLDYLLIVPAGLGIAGAALATVAGYMIPAVAGIFFFLRKNQPLHFARPKWDGRVLLQSCFNGSSEMVTNLANAIITFLFNLLMLRYLGEDGVAAVTIVLYAQFLLTALYLGFSIGVAPVISYHYGSANHPQLKKIFRICMTFIACSSVCIYCIAFFLTEGIVGIFSPPGSPVFEIARVGFFLFSFSFLGSGMNIFASGMFTAFSNGRVSAIISFVRTFAFILLGLLFLPLFWQVDGIWLAVPFAEALTLLLSLFFIYHHRHEYHYA